MNRLRSCRRCGLVALLLTWLVLLAVPGYAQQGDAVSTVNGEPISRDAFHARVRLVRWQYLHQLATLYELTGGNLALTPTYVTNLVTSLQNPVSLGDAILAEMETERLLWQTGEELGLVPTLEDAQEHEAAFFSLWTNVPVSELERDAEAQAFIASWYADAQAASGLSREDIQALFATEALRTRLFNHLGSTVPTEEPAVRSRHILCSFHPDNPADTSPPNQEQREAAQMCIRAAQARLATGEPFADVAAALSDDESSAVKGGDIGWALLSYLAEGYADAARDAELDTVIGPVETDYGLHLIEVQDRRLQALTDEEYETSKQGYFTLWLETLREEATIERAPDWDADLPVEPALESLDSNVQEAITRLQAN